MDIYQIVNAQVRPWTFNVFITFAIVLIVLSIILISFCITLWQVIMSIGLYIYMFSVLSSTLFTRMPSVSREYNLMPFWSYIKIINQRSKSLLIQVLLNCVMLFPIGFLLPLAIKKDLSWKWCFLICFLFSLSIEISQFIFKLGLFEWDDIFHNVLGGMIGFMTSKFIIGVFGREDKF